MKKALVILLVLMVCVCAYAESIDLSGMSYDELLDLRQAVEMAIWNSDGWQEVEVPAGIYVIGEDIPEGRWTVKPNGSLSSITVYPDKSDYTDRTYDYIAMEMIQKDESFNLEVNSGNCLEISGGALIFTPYVSAGLGFK